MIAKMAAIKANFQVKFLILNFIIKTTKAHGPWPNTGLCEL